MTVSGSRSAPSSAPPPADDRHHDDNDIWVVTDPGTEPETVVEGPAGALDAWLRRRGDASAIRVRGDLAVHDHFREAVSHPTD